MTYLRTIRITQRMQLHSFVLGITIGVLAFTAGTLSLPGGTFRVVTYNLEGYLLSPVSGWKTKSDPSRAKLREALISLRPDVLALQEVGGREALTQIQRELKDSGIDLPYAELAAGHDRVIQVALLSRFPISGSHSATNESFLLHGRRHFTSRGILDVELAVESGYTLNVLVAHLKSRRQTGNEDQAAVRLEEAKLLREIIDRHLEQTPNNLLIVAGDFNDSKNSAPLKTLVSRGGNRLVDLHPAERTLGGVANPTPNEREITWTHYYGVEDSYTRIDYILCTPGMARQWLRDQSYVLAFPGWGEASDHRPVAAVFDTGTH